MIEVFQINPWIILVLLALWFAAFMTGLGLANTWRAPWQVFVYCLLLGLTDRFLVFALYGGELLSIAGYAVDTGVLTAIAFTAFRITLAGRMVTQYPWLYERVGLFGWRDRHGERAP